jgi:hypothetical protein
VLLVFRANSTPRASPVAVAAPRQGVGAALLAAAEQPPGAAAATACAPGRSDNPPRAPCERNGYRRFGGYSGYYADGQAAVRVEKRVAVPEGLPGNRQRSLPP